MNAPTRQFDAKPAVRERVPLLIGLFGASSSGKTKSALRIADGIRSVVGGEIFGIDTESRRMAHYADAHKFQHLEFGPPFGSLDYLAALRYCVGKGASVIIVDSMSHEHDGPGGMLDMQEKEVDRLAGDDYARRERVKMLAWQKPKSARRNLISGLLQLNANFIFCFRARERTKPIKINGKTEIVEMGFMPIAGDEFLFEQTANCLLLPKSGGIPTWESQHMGERSVMKLPEYLAHVFFKNKVLDETTGRQLAEWAKGGSTAPQASVATAGAAQAPAADDGSLQSRQPAAGATDDDDRIRQLNAGLAEAAQDGMAALRDEWASLHAADQKRLKAALDRIYKPQAETVDRERNAAEEPA